MIYAHLGIASDLNQAELKKYIKVDYRQSCEALYDQTARYLFETLGPEKFFPHLEDRELETARPDLASWAPDWSLKPSGTLPMYSLETLSHRSFDATAHFVFTGNPLVLAIPGYEVDTISSVSLVLPDPVLLNTPNRKAYQEAASGLDAMYQSGSGVWWSGDENGQYRHVNLAGREVEHERLCMILVQEWLRIMTEELPLPEHKSIPAEYLNSHRVFVEGFRSWLKSVAQKGVIMTSSDSDMMQGLMWRYLLPRSIPSVFPGRRMAMTESHRVAVVPKSAKCGDRIVYLAGSNVSVLLRSTEHRRSHELEKGIREALVSNQKKTGKSRRQRGQNHRSKSSEPLAATKAMLIESYRLLGECYLDGEEGWTAQIAVEPIYKIFALR